MHSSFPIDFCCGLFADRPGTGAVGGEALQQHYNDAQELQRTGKLNEAAEQYRAFLADALGELAMGYGVAGTIRMRLRCSMKLWPWSPILLLCCLIMHERR